MDMATRTRPQEASTEPSPIELTLRGLLGLLASDGPHSPRVDRKLGDEARQALQERLPPEMLENLRVATDRAHRQLLIELLAELGCTTIVSPAEVIITSRNVEGRGLAEYGENLGWLFAAALVEFTKRTLGVEPSLSALPERQAPMWLYHQVGRGWATERVMVDVITGDLSGLAEVHLPQLQPITLERLHAVGYEILFKRERGHYAGWSR